MRKLITLGLSLLFFILSAEAQKNTQSYGINTGVNLNTARGNVVYKPAVGVLPGIHLGAYYKINFTNTVALKIMLAYDQMGWAYRSLYFENSNGTGIVKGDVLQKINYLNLPVVAAYSFGKKIKFTAEAGVFTGLLLNNKTITKITEAAAPNTPPSTTKSSSANRKKINYGLVAGAGMALPLTSSTQLHFNCANNFGLANIYKSSPGQPTTTIKTNTFSITAGLSFLIK